MTDRNGALRTFGALWSDALDENQFFSKRPLLAHYTSIQVLEKIVSTSEVWFANPLFMNDFEEVQFGIFTANQIVFERKEEIANACKTPERAQRFEHGWVTSFNKFSTEHAFDTYIFCLSDHKKDDYDGKLSMWRGYGANGNGAAIVIDTAKLDKLSGSPLIFAQVQYETTEARRTWLSQKVQQCEQLLAAANISDEDVDVAAYALFERIKLYALFTKHHGFKEEEEWRIVYMPSLDAANRLKAMFHYFIGARGVEPKLKFKIEPMPGITSDDLSLEKITDRIILGPTASSPLAKASVLRMLEIVGRPELKDRVHASGIPFRA